MCRIYTADYRSLAIGDVRFDCPSECLEFVQTGKASELSYRKVPHESNDEYVRQNTALVALHSWPRKINSKCALVSEHHRMSLVVRSDLSRHRTGQIGDVAGLLPHVSSAVQRAGRHHAAQTRRLSTARDDLEHFRRRTER